MCIVYVCVRACVCHVSNKAGREIRRVMQEVHAFCEQQAPP